MQCNSSPITIKTLVCVPCFVYCKYHKNQIKSNQIKPGKQYVDIGSESKMYADIPSIFVILRMCTDKEIKK